MRFVVIAVAGVVFSLCAVCRASATTELCPVRLHVDYTTPDPANQTYAYELSTSTPGSIDATMIADTDKGWYAWHVTGVQSAAVETSASSATGGQVPSNKSFESPRLEVTFPAAVIVSRAWITSANGRPCDVATQDDLVPSAPDSATTAPASTPVPELATAAVAPSPLPQCDRPFTEAAVRVAAAPASPKRATLYERTTALVMIQLDEAGNVTNAWIYRSAGDSDFDSAALTAAKRTTYTPATAYCRPMKSRYLFAATFNAPAY